MNVATKTQDSAPQTIFLKDYQPPAYGVKNIELFVGIDTRSVKVISKQRIVAQTREPAESLILQGQDQDLIALSINGQPLTKKQFRQRHHNLVIDMTSVKVAREFTLQIETVIDPYNNTALEGLYESKGMLCTQCEAEGFRRITYYIDRPDNMAIFTTHIEADKTKYPVLLANGNLVESEDLSNGRHRVIWHDPYPKPSYLFAMVAGDLAVKQDAYTTMSGRKVTIAFYTAPADQDKINFAIEALKKSMSWDEERYGREYDLDIYMVVAVSHFNMGAMENKGLNIFNSRCVLASPQTTTDQQYASVESIIAHEYFHNWSGNRVTCRDWFQLSLKEGFTVFRDQHFSEELDSWLEHRVGAVKVMRSVQFAEDAGPMAHPVRPQEYMEINNFYTVTVYDKGAEVVRMIRTLLGPHKFRQGTDRYFDRFDGLAVTTEDFVSSVTENTDFDREVFQRWYDQPGTPVVKVQRIYDAAKQTLTLQFAQHYPALPNWQAPRQPVLIPLRLGVVGADGQPINLRTDNPALQLTDSNTDGVFIFKEQVAELCLEQVPSGAVPSLLRGFSAPVILDIDLSPAELALLVSHDEDLFNRWDAAQTLLTHAILQPDDYRSVFAVFHQVLTNDEIAPEARALICQLPAYTALEQVQVQRSGSIEVEQLLQGQEQLRQAIAQEFEASFISLVEQVDELMQGREFSPQAEDRGWRSIRNLAFYYLASLNKPSVENRLLKHYDTSNNLTDRLAGLRQLVHGQYDGAATALEQFVKRFSEEELAMNAWFEVQASNPSDQCLAQVQQLQQHFAYDPKSPNHVRSVVSAFCRGNPRQFHRADASGYEFLADMVIQYNQSNPQLAARLLGPLIGWRQYDEQRQQAMRSALEKIMAVKDAAPDVFEVVSKSLGR